MPLNPSTQASNAAPAATQGVSSMPADPLAQLRPLHLPDPVSWWPPAPGWWLLATLIICTTLIAAVLLWRHHKKNRYRRAALQEAAQLTAQFSAQPLLFCQHINRLLKRVAIHIWPKELTAGLYGQRWFDFLNGQCPRAIFSPASIELLTNNTYQAEATISPDMTEQLHREVMLWIKQHRRTVNTSTPFLAESVT